MKIRIWAGSPSVSRSRNAWASGLRKRLPLQMKQIEKTRAAIQAALLPLADGIGSPR